MSQALGGLLVEHDSTLPLVQLSLASCSGGALDAPGSAGLTRVAARLMRRTAAGRSAPENEALVERLGASLGVEVGYSSVGISGACLARRLPAVIQFLAELSTASLELKELERVVQETRAELGELLDSDEHLAQVFLQAAVLGEHPYARSLLGTRLSLGAIEPEAVQACLAAHFSPDNLMLGLAGAVDEATARRLGDEFGKAWSPRAGGAEASSSTRSAQSSAGAPGPPAARAGRHLLFVDKPQRSQNQILMGRVGTHPRDADHIPLVVANTIFGGTFSARLSHEIRAERGWSYSAYSGLGYERQAQLLSVWTQPNAEVAAECLKLQLEMAEALWQRGVEPEELRWAKRHLVHSQAFARDTAAKRLSLKLESELWDLPPGYHDSLTHRIESVSVDQINDALRRRLTPADWTIVVVGSHAEQGSAIEAAIPELTSARVVSYDQVPG